MKKLRIKPAVVFSLFSLLVYYPHTNEALRDVCDDSKCRSPGTIFEFDCWALGPNTRDPFVCDDGYEVRDLSSVATIEDLVEGETYRYFTCCPVGATSPIIPQEQCTDQACSSPDGMGGTDCWANGPYEPEMPCDSNVYASPRKTGAYIWSEGGLFSHYVCCKNSINNIVIPPAGSTCDESKCLTPSGVGEETMCFALGANAWLPFSCAAGYEVQDLSKVASFEDPESNTYYYYACCPPGIKSSVLQECTDKACSSPSPRWRQKDCWADGRSEPMTCSSSEFAFPRKTGTYTLYRRDKYYHYVCCNTRTRAPTPRTANPTPPPTKVPTSYPTASPTLSPTSRPSPFPTLTLTRFPTDSPTVSPTPRTSPFPTPRPTRSPSARPTTTPTIESTVPPTSRPSPFPTPTPTRLPSDRPTTTPTIKLTSPPTAVLTPMPSQSPNPPPSPSPSPLPTTTRSKVSKDIGEAVDKPKVPAPDGKRETGIACLNNADCISNTCRNGVCMASSECYPVKHKYGKEFDKNSINIVFVGSAFNSTTLETWRQQVKRTYRFFRQYPMFDWGVHQLNVFRVDPIKPVGSFCDFGCLDIDRLLCCDVEMTESLSSKCFSVGSNLQTLVIHNSLKYGGAGYTDDNIAVMSLHEEGLRVAVHELGHSLFELGDEYTYGTGVDQDPNCDATRDCSKWSDLIENTPTGYEKVACVPGCKDGNYFVSGSTLMRALRDPLGAANTRFTCCTFQALTKSMPSYCRPFDIAPNYLFNYCRGNDYQQYGAANYGTTDFQPYSMPYLGPPMELHKYVYVEVPVLVKVQLRRNGKAIVRDDPVLLPSGLYLKKKVRGDFSQRRDAEREGKESLLKVKIFYKGGKELLLFATDTRIDVPLLPETSNRSIVDDAPRQVTRKSKLVELILDTEGRKIRRVRGKTIPTKHTQASNVTDSYR